MAIEIKTPTSILTRRAEAKRKVQANHEQLVREAQDSLELAKRELLELGVQPGTQVFFDYTDKAGRGRGVGSMECDQGG